MLKVSFPSLGKPGLLCLEGESRAVERYMAAIKSESWSDIPPHQKKVSLDSTFHTPRFLEERHSLQWQSLITLSAQEWLELRWFSFQVTERLRKPLPDGIRAFNDMREITHLIPQYGQYNHRGEMGEVRRLMDTWGVGDDFNAVVLNSPG
jgi:hypothetical protein